MTAPVDELAATASGDGEPSAADASGKLDRLGRYRLERELGAGGMGVVYAAHDPELDRRVALKMLRTVSDDARVRLLQEARAMARLTHPNVVTVYEVGTVDGRDYVAMELVDGMSLAQWLDAGDHAYADRFDAVLAAGRGLEAAHAAGLVHRDFKPHNILRARDGRILVTDFGLARMYETAGATDASTSGPPSSSTSGSFTALTRTGVFVGTPAYMAPEQWRGEAVTPASDQFAFCIALWEAIARKRPFTGSTLDELRAAIERGATMLDMSALPSSLRSIVRRGLDPDPTRRWPTMTALHAALAATRVRRRRWWPIAAPTAAVVAIALGALVVTREPRGRMRPSAGDNSIARPQPNDHDAKPLTMQFTKIVGDRVTAPQRAIDGLIEALKTKAGGTYVPTIGGRPGLKLYAIHGGSYLDAIGLQNGDLLVAIDGKPVDTADHVNAALQGLTSKPTLRLDVNRVGVDMTLTIEASK